MTPRVLILSSSLFTDRMLTHSSVLTDLAEKAEVTVWTMAGRRTGSSDPDSLGRSIVAKIEAFPEVVPPRLLPTTLLQRLADASWDARHRPASRVHARRDGYPPKTSRWFIWTGRALGRLHLDVLVERLARRTLLSEAPSRTLTESLSALGPDLVLVTSPFHSLEPQVGVAARQQGRRVVALVPSWDNLSTKHRLVFPYDAIFVWSKEQARQFRRLYPREGDTIVHVIGAPQYDPFFDSHFHEDRVTWCARHGLDPARPVVVYSLGSPNMFDEVAAAVGLAAACDEGKLANAQLLVRPHPIHDPGELKTTLSVFGPDVHVQAEPHDVRRPVRERMQSAEEVQDWVSTFRHASVVVNLSSTCTLDAALFDRPVVNLDFDPGVGGRRTQLVREINRQWTHFAPVAQSDGVVLVDGMDELIAAVSDALGDDAAGREGRAWIVEFVIGPADGRAGRRFADAIIENLP